MRIFLWWGAVCVSLLGAARIPPQPLSFFQFKDMITCANHKTRSWMAYAHYGCCCSSGGRGTPIDELDRCCKTHDDCYVEAEKLPSCNYLLSAPFYNNYTYECNGAELTCKDTEDQCKAFICNCDRIAANCLAKAPYNTKNFMILNKEPCQ